MDDIEMNSHLLLGQINNVLDTVRLDEGCLGANVEDVDVYDVVALVRRVAEPLSLRQGISFTATVEPGIPIVRAEPGDAAANIHEPGRERRALHRCGRARSPCASRGVRACW